MAHLSDLCRETNITSLANVETLVVAYLTVQNTRMIALGGAATKITGALIVTNNCTDAGVTSRFIHRVSTQLNCKSLADITAVVAALEVYMTAVFAASAFSADSYFDFSIVTTMTS